MRQLALRLAAGTLLAVGLATPALAQDYTPPKPVEDNGVGLYVSNIAGSGFTYWRRLPAGWGFHISAIGWGQGSSAFMNAGGAVTKEFDRREWGSLYGLLAFGTALGSFTGGSGLQPAADLQTNITPGVGVMLGPIMLEAGYSIYRNSGGIGFVPAGGAGLIWRF